MDDSSNATASVPATPKMPIASAEATPAATPAVMVPRASGDGKEADDGRPVWMGYSVGNKGDSGDLIVEILQRTPKCFVYFNQEGSLSWEYGSDAVDADGSGAEAMHLISQVNASILGKRRRRRLLVHVADALASALTSKREDDQRDYFVHARAFVEATRTESLRLTYLISAFSAAVTIVVALLAVRGMSGLDPAVAPFLVSSALAAIGALLSVLLRFNQLEIDTYTSRLYTALGGISRVIVGAIFGSIFLMFHNAELLLTIIKGAPAIAAASLLAGFSERMIPELLGAFESKLRPQSNGEGEPESPAP